MFVSAVAPILALPRLLSCGMAVRACKTYAGFTAPGFIA